MKYLKRIITAIKAIYYLLRLAIIPKRSLIPLLKLGNILSETKAFDQATEQVLLDENAMVLTRTRYGPGIPGTDELLNFSEGSLGYLLGRFMKDNQLDQYPYPISQAYSTQEYLRERRRQLHDVLHVLLDYDTSLEGEAKVNAFICGQSAFPIPVIISAGVLLISIFKFPNRIANIYNDQLKAFQRGKHSQSIFAIKWEQLLDRPIHEARNILLSNNFKGQKASGSFRLMRV